MTTIPALTVWQPWASLIIADLKPYEFRGWAAPHAYRGRDLAIHAGARPVKRGEIADMIYRLRNPAEAWTTCLKPDALPLLERWHSNTGMLPLSSVLGIVRLGEPVRAHEIVGEFGGRLNDSDRDEHSNWAWPLTDIRPLAPIAPARGAQGFWNWRPD